MRWYIVIMLSTHFFIFRHLRIFAAVKLRKECNLLEMSVG